VPVLPDWQERATTDVETIATWWAGDFAGFNIGIATGRASGLWVLDIDTGHGPEAEASLAAGGRAQAAEADLYGADAVGWSASLLRVAGRGAGRGRVAADVAEHRRGHAGRRDRCPGGGRAGGGVAVGARRRREVQAAVDRSSRCGCRSGWRRWTVYREPEKAAHTFSVEELSPAASDVAGRYGTRAIEGELAG
jgi:hypothetical protein